MQAPCPGLYVRAPVTTFSLPTGLGGNTPVAPTRVQGGTRQVSGFAFLLASGRS